MRQLFRQLASNNLFKIIFGIEFVLALVFLQLFATDRTFTSLFDFIASILVIFSTIAIGSHYHHWSWTGFEQKTLWDWMQLAIVPLVIGIVALLFNMWISDSTLSVAKDNQEDAALQAYIDKISELQLSRSLTQQDELTIRNIAQARTNNMLHSLDPTRKPSLLYFLIDSGLTCNDKPLIDLNSVDLSDTNLFRANLHNCNLSYANISRATLQEANLSTTFMTSTLLIDTRMQASLLTNSHLNNAVMNRAILKDADLSNVELTNANLGDADLTNAQLINANLSSANLTGAILNNANFSNANLLGAIVTSDQLATARSLKDAILPDGSKHN